MSDLILTARRIHVLGTHAPVQALLIREGRIVVAGTADEARGAALPGVVTEHVDGVVTPGLTDAHVHLTTWALARRRVDLNTAPTLDDGVSAVAEAARAGDGWVRGLGWDRHRWGALPTKEPLDRVCPGRPVFLQSHDLHGIWVNSEALRRCGITRDTPDPDGGEIIRDPATGEPTGVLLEEAMKLVSAHLPADSPEDVRDALLDAQRECHALGLTGVHSVEVTGLQDFSAMQQDGVLRLRVLQAIQLNQLENAIGVGLRSGFGGEWIRIGGLKMFLDGALGSRTAWMREAYEGTPGNLGISTLPPDEFRAHVRRAAEAGISSTVHAIGDAAVELAIDVLGSAPRVGAMPHRIEHVQLCPPDLWERAGRSGLIGSMQPIHLMTDIPTAERNWGHERSRGAYPFSHLVRAGMTLAFGSDVPVESCDPRLGLFSAVRRVGWDGEPADGWWQENAVTPEQALRAYTEGPAAAAGLAHRTGRLLPGYDADLVAWDVDPLACTPDEVRSMTCLLTMVAGETVHRIGQVPA